MNEKKKNKNLRKIPTNLYIQDVTEFSLYIKVLNILYKRHNFSKPLLRLLSLAYYYELKQGYFYKTDLYNDKSNRYSLHSLNTYFSDYKIAGYFKALEPSKKRSKFILSTEGLNTLKSLYNAFITELSKLQY